MVRNLILGVVLVACLGCFNLLVFASEEAEAAEPEVLEVSEPTSTVQDEQSETTRSGGSEADSEQLAQSEPEPDYYNHGDTMGFDAENDFETYVEISVPDEIILQNTQILMKLSSIEYHLKILSGGMILATCSLFIWFTILKPIKNFTSF